jgi:hypothetical protein
MFMEIDYSSHRKHDIDVGEDEDVYNKVVVIYYLDPYVSVFVKVQFNLIPTPKNITFNRTVMFPLLTDRFQNYLEFIDELPLLFSS